MKCFNHRDVEANGFCTRCGKAVCKNCCREVNDKLVCIACIAQGGSQPHVAPVQSFSDMSRTGGETLLSDTAANLYIGAIAAGGRVKITDKRVIFTPHALNIHSQPVEIPMSNISTAGDDGGIIGNKMFVMTKNGQKYVFVVWGKQRLISLINAQKK